MIPSERTTHQKIAAVRRIFYHSHGGTSVRPVQQAVSPCGSPGRVFMADIADKIRKKLVEEIKALEHELHSELPKELSKARAHGDLSENAEFKYAKERQSYVSARLGQLHERMAGLAMLNLSTLPRDRAAYGSRLRVLDLDKDEEIEYRLVTSEEADAANGLISTTSPIGRALMGKKVGDEVNVVTPAGKKQFEVLKLATIYEED